MLTSDKCEDKTNDKTMSTKKQTIDLSSNSGRPECSGGYKTTNKKARRNPKGKGPGYATKNVITQSQQTADYTLHTSQYQSPQVKDTLTTDDGKTAMEKLSDAFKEQPLKVPDHLEETTSDIVEDLEVQTTYDLLKEFIPKSTKASFLEIGGYEYLPLIRDRDTTYLSPIITAIDVQMQKQLHLQDIYHQTVHETVAESNLQQKYDMVFMKHTIEYLTSKEILKAIEYSKNKQLYVITFNIDTTTGTLFKGKLSYKHDTEGQLIINDSRCGLMRKSDNLFWMMMYGSNEFYNWTKLKITDDYVLYVFNANPIGFIYDKQLQYNEQHTLHSIGGYVFLTVGDAKSRPIVLPESVMEKLLCYASYENRTPSFQASMVTMAKRILNEKHILNETDLRVIVQYAFYKNVVPEINIMNEYTYSNEYGDMNHLLDRHRQGLNLKTSYPWNLKYIKYIVAATVIIPTCIYLAPNSLVKDLFLQAIGFTGLKNNLVGAYTYLKNRVTSIRNLILYPYKFFMSYFGEKQDDKIEYVNAGGRMVSRYTPSALRDAWVDSSSINTFMVKSLIMGSTIIAGYIYHQLKGSETPFAKIMSACTQVKEYIRGKFTPRKKYEHEIKYELELLTQNLYNANESIAEIQNKVFNGETINTTVNNLNIDMDNILNEKLLCLDQKPIDPLFKKDIPQQKEGSTVKVNEESGVINKPARVYSDGLLCSSFLPVSKDMGSEAFMESLQHRVTRKTGEITDIIMKDFIKYSKDNQILTIFQEFMDGLNYDDIYCDDTKIKSCSANSFILKDKDLYDKEAMEAITVNKKKKGSHGKIIPYSGESFIMSFPPPKRPKLSKAWEGWKKRLDKVLTEKDYIISAFTKAETVMKQKPGISGIDTIPRMIQPAPPLMSVLIGRWIKSFSKYMAQAFNGDRGITYSSGLDCLGVGDFIVKSAKLLNCDPRDLVGIENDFSKFDTTLGVEMLTIEQWFYKKFMTKKDQKIVLKAIQLQLKTKGYSKFGDYYELDGGRHSGDPNTSAGNSILNALLLSYAINSSYTGDMKPQLGVNYTMIVLGDDNLILMTKKFADGIDIKIATNTLKGLGMDPKLNFKNHISKMEFCSGIFAPLSNGRYMLTPKPGRFLTRIGATMTRIKITKTSALGKCFGLKHIMGNPCFSTYVKHLERIVGCKMDKSQHVSDEYAPHIYKLFKEQDIELDKNQMEHFFLTRYGFQMDWFIQDLDDALSKLDTISSCYKSTQLMNLVFNIDLGLPPE